MSKDNLRGGLPDGVDMTERFGGIAAILAEKADLSGRMTTHYSVIAPSNDPVNAFQPFRMAILYDPESSVFDVVQTQADKTHRNVFTINDDGEVTSYCDHMPPKSFVEALQSGEGLPTSLEAFDLKHHTQVDAIEIVSKAAVDTVNLLGKYGQLDKNLDPRQWASPGSR